MPLHFYSKQCSAQPNPLPSIQTLHPALKKVNTGPIRLSHVIPHTVFHSTLFYCTL
uniref:Uncharacterized protein n=1 Tax=Astyanax mexicanus TaxID=7994 RepID=A0A3B1IT49_ASTMX